MEPADGLRFLFASAFQDGDSAEVCPSPETLVDTLDLRLEPAARAEVVDHLSECPVCAEAWRLLCLGGAP